MAVLYNPGMRKLWRDVLDGIAPYDAGRPLDVVAAELGLPGIVRLSANENPLGPSPHVVQVIAEDARNVHLYPDGGSVALRDALGRRLGIVPDQIVIGNGADELLAMIAWAAFEPGDDVIVPQPSFEPYTTVVTLMGATLVASPLAGYETDLDDMRRRVTSRTKAIVLCSPHNPTATIVRQAPLLAFLDSLGLDGPLVILDEAYRDFCDDPDYPDGVALLVRYPRLVVLRTFSKIAGLAGLRVGYGIGAIETINRLNRVRAPYNANRLGQAGALAAVEDTEHWERTREAVIAERTYLTAELGKRGFAFPPSQANFVLVRVADADLAHRRLLEAGILVRNGAGVGFPGHLRIAIGLRETNERLLRVLEGLSPG
jgi:histidinol-phosphate aminotransferase